MGRAVARAHAATACSADANKGKFGHVLVIGGSVGKSGAPAMTSLTAMRAGAGLVTAAVPAPVLAAGSAFAPELMTWPLPDNACGTDCGKGNYSRTVCIAHRRKDGAGDWTGTWARTRYCRILLSSYSAETKMPAVIDADALNVLSANPQLAAKMAQLGKAGRTLVLTPHPGEMARLAEKSVAEVQANRLEIARSFAQKNGVTLVLKGWRTLIAHPDGSVAVNTTGNPGMAKGGSGDMLTGLIAGLLAQYQNETARAVEAAVYLHGLAADLAVSEVDEHTLLATDIVA